MFFGGGSGPVRSDQRKQQQLEQQRERWRTADPAAAAVAAAATATKPDAAVPKQYRSARLLASWRHRRIGRSSNSRRAPVVRVPTAQVQE